MSLDSTNEQLRESLSRYQGFVFRWQNYRMLRADWDHDHCLGCWVRFAERPYEWPDEVHTAGWVTLWPVQDTDVASQPRSLTSAGLTYVSSPTMNGYQLDWLCPECFEACRELLGFVVDPDHPQWRMAGL